MIKLLLRAWELIAWIQAIQYFVSVVFAQLLGRPHPQLPAQLSGTSQSSSRFRHSFYQSPEFALVELLEANWSIILSELDRLDDKYLMAWREQFFHKEGWETFGLYADGLKMEENCRLCPETTRLIERIPNLLTAHFSALASGNYLTSLPGQTERVLCCYLGLVIPDQCGIRIGTVFETWRQGKCLIFDANVEHEVWNQSDSAQVVLSIAFNAPERLLSCKSV